MDLSPRPSGQSVMSDSYASTLSTKFFPLSTKASRPTTTSKKQQASSDEKAAAISRATTQAIAAARSIILSGGTSASALCTAEAAAQSVLSPQQHSGNGHSRKMKPPRAGYLERRKCKQQAQVIANMALVSVRSNIQQGGGGGGGKDAYGYAASEDPTAVFIASSHKNHHTLPNGQQQQQHHNKVENVYFEKANATPKVVSPMLSSDMDSGLCCGSPPAAAAAPKKASSSPSHWLSPRSNSNHHHHPHAHSPPPAPGTPSTAKSADSPQTNETTTLSSSTTTTTQQQGEYFRKKQERVDTGTAENQTSPKIRVDIVASHSIATSRGSSSSSSSSSSSDEEEEEEEEDDASDASSNDDDDETAGQEEEEEECEEEDTLSYDRTEGESNATDDDDDDHDGVSETFTLDTDFTDDVEGTAGALQPYTRTIATTTASNTNQQQQQHNKNTAALMIVPHTDDDDDMTSSMFSDPLKALSHAITCTPLHSTSPRFDYRDDVLDDLGGRLTSSPRDGSDGEGSVDRFFNELKGAAVDSPLGAGAGAGRAAYNNSPSKKQLVDGGGGEQSSSVLPNECSIEQRVLNALASAIHPPDKRSSPLEVDTKLSSSQRSGSSSRMVMDELDGVLLRAKTSNGSSFSQHKQHSRSHSEKLHSSSRTTSTTSPRSSLSPSKWLRSSPRRQRVFSRETTASSTSPRRQRVFSRETTTAASPGRNGIERPLVLVDKAVPADATHSSAHRSGRHALEPEQQQHPAVELINPGNGTNTKKKSWLQRKTRMRAMKRLEL